MSKTHRLGRSLPIAGAAALLVVGASFAHDSALEAPTAAAPTHEVGTGDDDRQIDGLAGTDWESADDQQGGEDDLAGKIADDAEVGDQDVTDDQVAPEAPKPAKPAKTHKAKPAAPRVTSSHDGAEAKDSDENDDADENNDESGDGEHDDSHDGDQQDGGGEHDDGGDDGGDD